MRYNTFRRLLKNTPPCLSRTYSFYPHPSVPDWAVDNHPFPLASMPSAKYWRGKASQPYPLSSYKLKSHSFPFIFLDISLCSLALIKTTVLLVYGLRIVWNILSPSDSNTLCTLYIPWCDNFIILWTFALTTVTVHSCQFVNLSIQLYRPNSMWYN